MAVVPERISKTRQPLHNFILPPNGLKWGSQKFMRCIKIDVPNKDDPPIPGRKSINRLPSSSSSSLVNSGEQKQEKMEKKRKEVEDECVRPWNLRTRRAACKEPKRDLGLVSSPGKRGRGGGMVVVEERKGEESEENKRVKFCVRLCKEEIENDLVAITGNKPHRRPKKRPRALQRQLDELLPGMWLTEITPDSYKVPDDPETGKG